MSADAGLVVVVTGLSGAGKSTALNALEDLGFYCVDNLPIPVIPETLAACEQGGVRRIALGIDVRVRSFLDRAGPAIDGIAAVGGRDVDVVFFDASDDALIRRFSSTRRPHPITLGPANTEAKAVLDGIRLERERLAVLRGRARHVIDTTELSVHDLRRRMISHYGPGNDAQPGMRTRVLSFGFKYGAPVDADLVIDVRFIDNPYFVEELRPLSGLDGPVRDHVLGSDDAREFSDRLTELLVFCLPRYEREGKSYLTVALGCTGGRHRSVALAKEIGRRLGSTRQIAIEIVHRDLDRDRAAERSSDSRTGGRAREGAA